MNVLVPIQHDLTAANAAGRRDVELAAEAIVKLHTFDDGLWLGLIPAQLTDRARFRRQAPDRPAPNRRGSLAQHAHGAHAAHDALAAGRAASFDK